MASPQSGRRSYARRAQYGAFAAYVIAVAGGALGLLAALLWVVDPVGFGNLRILASEATAPIARLINGGGSAVGGVDDAVAAWWRAGSQNAELRRDLTQARRELIRARGLEAENRQLRDVLGLTQGVVDPIAVARLLSSSAQSTRRFALIDAGVSDGVRSGQPVRSADGLIGRTLEVGPTVARILLITDQQSIVPARRARDGWRCWSPGGAISCSTSGRSTARVIRCTWATCCLPRAAAAFSRRALRWGSSCG